MFCSPSKVGFLRGFKVATSKFGITEVEPSVPACNHDHPFDVFFTTRVHQPNKFKDLQQYANTESKSGYGHAFFELLFRYLDCPHHHLCHQHQCYGHLCHCKQTTMVAGIDWLSANVTDSQSSNTKSAQVQFLTHFSSLWINSWSFMVFDWSC